jgi:hypothetical protein
MAEHVREESYIVMRVDEVNFEVVCRGFAILL